MDDSDDELLLTALDACMDKFEDFNDDLLITLEEEECVDDLEEWPGLKNPTYKLYLVSGIYESPLPLLIREIGRLIPFKKPGKRLFVEFHPFNMPDYKIRNFEIVGIIVAMRSNVKYQELHVYDGTGTMMVLYKTEKYKEDLDRRSKIDLKYKIEPKDVKNTERLMRQVIKREDNTTLNRRQFQKANELWWKECNQGMLGKPFEIGGYVRVSGFCNVKNKSLRDDEGNDFWATNMMPSVIFNAYKINCITEREHNHTLHKWMCSLVKNRYVKEEKKKAH